MFIISFLESDKKVEMKEELMNRLGNTLIYIARGNPTQIPADALITTIDSGDRWYSSTDELIRKVADEHYHAQAEDVRPLTDMQTVVARGHKEKHYGAFDDVIFIVDDLLSPLEKVIYMGLVTAHIESYRTVLIPPHLRTSSMLGVVEKTPEEYINGLTQATEHFFRAYGAETLLEEIKFVVCNDYPLFKRLEKTLSRMRV
jgi:hypothetical protein